MKIAALQMVSTPSVEHNLATAARLIAEAAAAGAQWVALPEYFCLIGHSDRDKLAIAENVGAGPIQGMLSDAARSHGVWVIGGTLPIRSDDADRVFNACCVYAPDGALAARYDKIHLFCFDNGRERYDEGRVLRAGTEPVAFTAAVAGTPAPLPNLHLPDSPPNPASAASLRVGLSICYDLRFPELYRALMAMPGQPPCDLIAVPAAFTHTTGQAHWELLLRARAAENQCYVIAPAQGGLHENGRRTWGHSMVIDPWGEVIAVLPEGEGVVLAELDLTRLAAVRAQLPALGHRCL